MQSVLVPMNVWSQNQNFGLLIIIVIGISENHLLIIFDCGATNLLESVFTIAKFIAFAAALFLLLL